MATPDWWRAPPQLYRISWRGRLAIAYVRFMVGMLRLLPQKNLRAPDFDWPAFRRTIARFDGVAAKLPRDIVREPAGDMSVAGEWFVPQSRADTGLSQRTILYVHGGSYVLDRTALHDTLAAELARAAAAPVLAVDYRLAPEHPFPAGIEDVVATYRDLLAAGRRGADIGLVGDSAGGGLALAALISIRDQGLPMPAAFVALSPWADLSFSGASIITNAHSDPFMSDVEFVSICAELYLQGASARAPLASPALADLGGMPPTLVHVGSTDLLLDDSRRIVDGIRRAGGRARLDIWRNMPHVWQRLKAYIPEASASLTAIGQFLKVTIPDHQRAGPVG